MLSAKSTIFLILSSIVILVDPVDAKTDFMFGFNDQYPNSTLINRCEVCHVGSERTPYANDWATSNKDFTVVEDLDSDGDGTINIDEIEAGTNPGVSEAYSYYLPFFIGHTNHWTGIGLRNCSLDNTAAVVVFVYDTNGSISESDTISIAARGHDVFTIGNGQPSEGWIRINSTQPLVGLCFVATTGTTNYMADIPFASELSKFLIIPHIGQGPVYDTIVMVCNPSPSATTVTLTLIDQQGTPLYEKSQLVPANGSWKYELKELVLNSSTPNYGSLEISASNGLSAFALYNNLKKGGYSYAGISAIAPP
jgi:hypothetical protein